MKRILAITLSLIFIITSFVACGDNTTTNTSSQPQTEVVLAPVDLTIKNFEKGKINYSSISEFTLEADDAYESMTKDYVYLPSGSTVSCDSEFGIYCFSNSFTVNQILMQGAGQSLDGYNPVLQTGTLTLKSDCYVRFVVKGSLADIKIEAPSDLASLVVCGTRKAMELQPKIKLVNDFLKTGNESVNYLFITDIHYGSGVDDLDGDGIRTYNTLEETAKQLEELHEYITTVVTIANNSDQVDFVVIGGDIVNGYETPDSPNYQQAKEKDPNITVGKHLLGQLQEILAPLKECTKPVFVLSGNHDDNTGHSIYRGNNPNQPQSVDNWHLSDLDWSRGVMDEFINVDIVRDSSYSHGGKSISKYYYYDLEKNGKTTRILCLDYNDDRFTFDSKGEVTARPNYGLYHEAQIKWLAEKGLQGDFDECLVFSHANMTAEQASIDAYSPGDLEGLLEAYQTKDRFKQGGDYPVSADFGSRTTGNIVLYHHGHEHKHYHSFDYKKQLWRLSTAMAVTSIDIISVNGNSIFKKELNNSLITELLRNGTENNTVQ
ncbi:MAG: metallophosphoesterase [Clostridia bacterium]|nr:metallophosphoesterase [Clostridia bacterium]